VKKLLIYLAAMFGSVVFLLVFVLVFVNSTDIACQRQADQTYTCQRQTLLLGRFPTFKRETTQIVDVDIFDDGCSDGCGYRAEFILSSGDQVAVNEVYTDYSPVSIQTMEMKRLLHSGQSSFEYNIKPAWWVLYLLGGLFVMDILILTLTLGLGALREIFVYRTELE
jgi:hypothetical protein